MLGLLLFEDMVLINWRSRFCIMQAENLFLASLVGFALLAYL
jgi:hypothetical protein